MWGDSVRISVNILAVAFALLLAGCVCAPVEEVGDVVRLPCCRVNNELQTVNISTGVATWRVALVGSDLNEAAVRAMDRDWFPAPHRDPEARQHGWSSMIPAEWVGVSATLAREDAFYDYTVQFRIPDCPSSGRLRGGRYVVVRGWMVADDQADLYVSDVGPIGHSSGPGDLQSFSDIEFFAPGSREPDNASERLITLRARVRNQGGQPGLLVQATVNTTCAAGN